MGLIGGRVGYWLLKSMRPKIEPVSPNNGDENIDTKTELFFGETFFRAIEGKTIIDFGCGHGRQSVEMAKMGAAKVIGIDIQEDRLEQATNFAQRSGFADRCIFTTKTSESADIIVSKDAFEHFSDPGGILQEMATLLKPKGYVLAAFGPTWLHPYGGHLFSVFPWSHLIFTEGAQIRWRSDFKADGATKFSEVDGGLNQLTIAQFEQIVAKSPFCLAWLDTIPIKGISLLKSTALREFGSSIVRCKLCLK